MDVQLDTRGALDGLDRLANSQVPFAMSRTIRFGLQSAKKAVRYSMDKHIEGGPTRWTRRGMKVEKPTKTNLRGALLFKATHGYMQEIMHGGTKHAKHRKLPEPVTANVRSTAELNKFGNIPRSLFAKAATDASRRYFMGVPRGRTNSPNNVGIWRRSGRKGSKKLTKVVSLKRSSRQQRVTFPAPRIARQAFNKTYRRQFSKLLEAAIKSSRGAKRLRFG